MIFTRLLFPVLLLGVSATFASSISKTELHVEKKVVCYWGSWSYYRPNDCGYDETDMDPSLCTHIIYAFTGLDANTCEMVSMDPWLDLQEDWGLNKFNKLNQLKEQNPDLKTLIAIGGWNEGSEKYSKMAANETCRGLFIADVLNFFEVYDFDGLDLDWEYPANRGGAPEDKQNFVLLCQELKAAFNGKYLLSAAVGAGHDTMELAYDVPALCDCLDFVNLMTYDFHGSWETVTGCHSSLFSGENVTGNAQKLNADYAVNYWLGRGCPSQNLILGIGTYGQGWTLNDANQTGVGAPAGSGIAAGRCTGQAGYLGYNEFCEKNMEGGWTTVWDDKRKVHYAYKGTSWISYDDPTSIAIKCDYIKEHGLGGAMIWSMETDDFNGKCGRKHPLLTTINEELGRKEPEVTPTTTTTTTTSNPDSNDPSAETTTTTTPVPCKKPDLFVCPESNGYYPHPHSCPHFYQCANKIAYLQKCTGTLHWSPSNKVCDWPAQCKTDSSYCLE